MIPAQAVGCCMNPLEQYSTVGENEKIHAALKVLASSMHKGGAWQGHRLVVVLNGDGEPTGILTIKGLLNAVGLKMLEEDPAFRAECFSWYYIKNMREKGKVTVREVMRPLAMFSIDINSTLSEAAQMFVRHGVNYLPVSEGGKITGILGLREVFYRYYELTGFMPTIEPRKSKPRESSRIVEKPATV
ncbi:MAG: CBS domain-containing protein [Peptococcaceae bacterium]|nr:CBS domain-containing protein [Peptococcaceae bacterium]